MDFNAAATQDPREVDQSTMDYHAQELNNALPWARTVRLWRANSGAPAPQQYSDVGPDVGIERFTWPPPQSYDSRAALLMRGIMAGKGHETCQNPPRTGAEHRRGDDWTLADFVSLSSERVAPDPLEIRKSRRPAP
ncbi:hypothetical protein CORC01_13348 [Colletotrichum orchidophilum]|uniref:Uncharacterized protein n=1 Tax=Colletotrichum orchidophilum TaxID=1209926 RepID=A0A1G4AQK0_9PEZI|nr:uncharacterized protein CORC01_13348 [Colletotrichum orchidophilum]OHE91371.1 hypothetical protein CORC01_13348 [Colletotrichum orchidophilum]